MLKLETLKGQVHRFTGTIDRFGKFYNGERQVLTVCVRELRIVSTDRAIYPDHWWFLLHQEFASLNLQAGDKIAFTAKIQRCKKGYQSSSNTGRRSPLRTTFGPGREVRDITLLERSSSVDRSAEVVNKQLQILLDTEQQDKSRLMKVVDALKTEVDNLTFFKQEHRQLVNTIAHLDRRIQSSFPRRWAVWGFCISALLCLVVGVLLGLHLNQTSTR